MGLFDQFPYTNFHELNLDWILKALKELEHTIDQFVAINALKYADPIQWDITSQYEKNTIVIDPQTGTAYISVQPVPIGVALTNPDYWAVVFDLGSFVVRAAMNLANTYEAETTLTATVNTPAGGWIVWGDTLYKALVNITAGDSYVDGGNITHFTIEDVTGHLEDLTTTDKSNLVAAINEVAAEVLGKIGNLVDLNTTDKSNLVAAINEVLSTLTSTTGDLADLNTTDKSNLVAAINEVLSTLTSTTGDLADLDTTDKSNLVAALNEVLSTLTNTTGDLADLNTTDKSNLVAAINEVNTTGGGALALIGDLADLDTTDKSNLVAAINENYLNIQNVANTIGAGTAKRVIVFSDSYGLTVGGVTPFTEVLQTALASTPVTYEYYAAGSLGITPNTAVPEGLSAYLDANWYSSITTPETVTDIVVAMGANDVPSANVALLPSYFVTLCANLKTKFPRAKISFAFIGQTYNYTVADRNTAIKAYIVNAKVNGCAYMDGSQYILADGTNLQNDGVHPTAAGAQYIADMIIQNLVNDSYHYKNFFTTTFTMDDDTAGYVHELYITIVDDIITCVMNQTKNYTAGQPYTFTTSFKTGTFTLNNPCRGNGSLPLVILVETSGGTHTLYLTINHGKPYIKAAYANLTLNTTTGFIGCGNTAMSYNN